MALVKFISCDAAAFASATTKDSNTLYFVTDQGAIYKGGTRMSGGVYKTVSSYPEKGEINTLYVNTSDGSTRFWNGTAYQDVVRPQTSIAGAGSGIQLASTKAVVDYVAAHSSAADVTALQSRMSAAEGKITSAEGKLATIQGTGDGSITKAAADALASAKSYTDQLAAGAVSTNANEIAKLKTGKADKATTLAGYGIGDAYTKAQADSAIAAAVAAAPHLKRAIVETLPAVASADANTIYMVGKGEGSETSNYKEYMLVNGKFELVGDSKVDLTDYAKTADVNTKVATAKSEAISTAAADAKTKADAAQAAAIASAAADAKTKADAAQAAATTAAATDATTKANKALADAKSYTDTAVGKIVIPDVSDFITAADIATGSANGTIAVEGKDVAVKGLGSAAYTSAASYDAAGAATTAQQAAVAQAKTETTNQVSAAKSALIGGTSDTSASDTIKGAKKYAEEKAASAASTALGALDVTDAAVSNQFVSAVSQTDGKIAVTRATLPVYSVTAATGDANGQVKITVNGTATNASVKGLGSAAYADTSAFDAAGTGKSQADAALAAAKAYVDAALTWGTL